MEIDGLGKQVSPTNNRDFTIYFTVFIAVSGESNFSMDHTGLTVGGFTQPSVARGLIEYPPNVEKGLCQRFLWLLPKPKPTFFANLEKVDESFSVSIGKSCSIQ